MARGRWYSRAALDAAIEATAQSYDAATPALTAEAANAAVAGIEAAIARGYVFEDQALASAAGAFDRAGLADSASRLRALIPVAQGPCVAETPN